MLTGIYHLYCTYIEVESDNHLAVAYQKVEQILQKENRDYHMLGRTGSESQSLIQRQTRNTAGLCKWDTVYCAHCSKKNSVGEILIAVVVSWVRLVLTADDCNVHRQAVSIQQHTDVS